MTKGEQLKHRRTSYGVKQSELAREMRYSISIVCNMEKNRHETHTKLFKLAFESLDAVIAQQAKNGIRSVLEKACGNCRFFESDPVAGALHRRGTKKRCIVWKMPVSLTTTCDKFEKGGAK